MMWQIPIPYSPFKNVYIITPIKGAGHDGPFCPLAIPVTVVQPGFVNGGGGGKARERSDRAGEDVRRGFPPPPQ